MMSGIDKNELGKTLSELIEELVRKGELSPQALNEKDKLIKNITDNLASVNYKFSAPDAQNNEIRDALKLAVKGEFTNSKSLKPVFNYKLLFLSTKNMTEEEKKELRLKLKSEVKNTLMALALVMGLDVNKPEVMKEIDRLADSITNRVLQKLPADKEFPAEDVTVKNTLNAMLDPLIEFRRVLYGIGRAGEIEHEISKQNMQSGNQMGVADTDNDPASMSFLAQSNNPDLCQADPLGIKFLAVLNSIGTGRLSETEENMLKMIDKINDIPTPEESSSYKSPTPFSITPKMPGTKV